MPEEENRFESFNEFASKGGQVEEQQKSPQEMADELERLGFDMNTPTTVIHSYFEAMGEDFDRLPMAAREVLTGLPMDVAVGQVYNSLRVTGRLAELEDERGG